MTYHHLAHANNIASCITINFPHPTKRHVKKVSAKVDLESLTTSSHPSNSTELQVNQMKCYTSKSNQIGAIWLDNPKFVESIQTSDSIPSNQVSRVFVAQVKFNTSLCHRVMVFVVLNSRANSCFTNGEIPTLALLLGRRSSHERFSRYSCLMQHL